MAFLALLQLSCNLTDNAIRGNLNQAPINSETPGDPTVAFVVTSSSLSESQTAVTLSVSLSVAASELISVDYTVTSSGTAEGAGIDYTLNNGTLLFYKGDITKEVVLTLIDDNINEPTETLIIELSGVTGRAELGASYQHTISILDNETVANIVFRSVGGAPGPLATGVVTTLSVVASVATFSLGLADIIGVGDALQYDSNDDGSLDAIAFIAQRNSSTEYVIKSSNGWSPPDTATPDQNWSLFRAYAQLADVATLTENTLIFNGLRDFDTGTQFDLVTRAQNLSIACYADINDLSVNVTFSSSNLVTSDSFQLKIYTPTASNEVGISQRHDGYFVWGKYQLFVNTAATHALAVEGPLQVTIEGLIFRWALNSPGPIINLKNRTNLSKVRFTNNIIWQANASPNLVGIESGGQLGLAPTLYAWNNVFFNLVNNSAIRVGESSDNPKSEFAYIYNNTFHSIKEAMTAHPDTTVVAINNLAQVCNSGSCYVGTYDASSSNNISSGSDAPGANPVQITSIAFSHIVFNDFRLDLSDSIARRTGIDLTNDTNLPFSTDLGGNIRRGLWDIGASESPNKIFRSMAYGTPTALHSGPASTDNMSITNGIATFASEVPTKIGLGDALQYDADGDGNIDTVGFISLRLSGTRFVIDNNLGEPSLDTVGGNQDWSLFRSYTSFDSHVAGTENSLLNAAIINFDTHTAGRNLTQNNEQWNLMVYADEGLSTVGDVYMLDSEWNTSRVNYLRFATPVDRSEVGVSQRHEGHWDDDMFRINFTNTYAQILIDGAFFRVEGFQIENTSADATPSNAFLTSFGEDTRILNNIIRNVDGNAIEIGGSQTNEGKAYLVNNVIYDCFTGISIQTYTGSEVYAYNNTIIDSTAEGITNLGSSAVITVLKNNLVQGSGGNGDYYLQNGVTASNSNISQDGSSPNGGSYQWKTIFFLDPNRKKYFLDPVVSIAFNFGTDLSGDNDYPFAEDAKGAQRLLIWDVGALERPTVIYRSYAYLETAALAVSGGTNTLSVTTDLVTFGTNLPLNVGLGDGIEYDSNNDGIIDSIGFITELVSANQFVIYNASGGNVADTSADDLDWSIYRAYTDFSSHRTGTENVSFNANIRDFDSFTQGQDLTSNNLKWNLMAYTGTADPMDVPTLSDDEWNTSMTNYFRLATPLAPLEVGIAQRHSGIWDDTKFNISVTNNYDEIQLLGGYFRVEGLQLENVDVNTANDFGISTTAAGQHILSHNILRNFDRSGIIIQSIQKKSGRINIINNIFYELRYGIESNNYSGTEITIYNNTFYDIETGVSAASGSAAKLYVKNNLVQLSSGPAYLFGDAPVESAANISDDNSSPNGAFQSKTVLFTNVGSGDFHLQGGDTEAKDLGEDLSSNLWFLFTDDIESVTRPGAWDIGASEL